MRLLKTATAKFTPTLWPSIMGSAQHPCP